VTERDDAADAIWEGALVVVHTRGGSRFDDMEGRVLRVQPRKGSPTFDVQLDFPFDVPAWQAFGPYWFTAREIALVRA
jgi:hypothetical protein